MAEPGETPARVAEGGRKGENSLLLALDFLFIQSPKVPFFPMPWANQAFDSQSGTTIGQDNLVSVGKGGLRSKRPSRNPTVGTHPSVKLKGRCESLEANAVKRAPR